MTVSDKASITLRESVYTVVLLAICLTVSLTGVDIGDIIEINGAVVGFFFIYFLPLITHIKCLYVPYKVNSPIAITASNSNKK